jgi:hypothetical protein
MGKLTCYETEAGQVRLSAKGQKAFEALCATGGKAELAAKLCGLSERQVRRLLAKPQVRAMMSQHARDTIAKAAPLAAAKLVALMSQDESRKVQLEAAVRVLDIQGVKPPQGPGPRVNVGIGIVGGIAGLVVCTREQRDAYEQLKASGALDGSRVGYVVDWSPPEGAPPERIAHQPERVPADA